MTTLIEIADITTEETGMCQRDYCVLRSLITGEDLERYVSLGVLDRQVKPEWKDHEETLFDSVDGCGRMCARKIIALREYDPRRVSQKKSGDYFKWRVSELVGRDIGEQISSVLWTNMGFAQLYAESFERNHGECNHHWKLYQDMERHFPSQLVDNVVPNALKLLELQDAGKSIYGVIPMTKLPKANDITR